MGWASLSRNQNAPAPTVRAVQPDPKQDATPMSGHHVLSDFSIYPQPPGVVQKQEMESEQQNRTGMTDPMKSGLEKVSGMDHSDLRVHYNSPKPAQIKAHAYTQGNEIHLGPGQEKHIAHEAWHAVQQKQGRVKATTQAKGQPVNDQEHLEKEADVMGQQVERAAVTEPGATTSSPS